MRHESKGWSELSGSFASRRQGTRSGLQYVEVLSVQGPSKELGRTAFKNKGVQAVLDAVIEFLPAPNEVAAIQGVLPGEEEKTDSNCIECGLVMNSNKDYCNNCGAFNQ